MRFKIFKNTVLFFVLVAISCGSKTKNEWSVTDVTKRETKNDSLSLFQTKTDTALVVGANQIDAYLPLLKEKQIAVVANQTSVVFKSQKVEANSEIKYTHLIDSLLQLDLNITKVFAPEHGFRGNVDAGEEVKDGIDTKTNLPIISLYGSKKKPSAAHLKGIDVVIFDIQDVGVRFYTYISSLHYVMEACAENDVLLLILDRPNPNGSYIDGPVLEKRHRSFLGMHPIPLVHGMTIGEYAKMINGEKWLKKGVQCQLKIIPVKNYTHQMEYSLPIKPSPNLPNDQSIKLYPSLGLFEGTNINAGRGTDYQFQRYGAPFLDKAYYQFSYTPVANSGAKYPKHKNTICYGVDLSNTTADRGFSLKYIMDAYKNATDKTKVFNTANFTAHVGTKKLQQQIESGMGENEIRASWKSKLNAYNIMRQPYLIYEN